MFAADRQPLARRADLSRPMEPVSVFQRREVRPRRALTTAAAKGSKRVARTVVGVIAGTALAGSLAMAHPTEAAATPIGHDLPKLHKGAQNSLVVRLQRELSAHGPNVADTGYYGKLTKKRVKRLQRKSGWKATGVVGDRVWHELLSDGHRVNGPSIKPYQAGHHNDHQKKHHGGGSSASSTKVWDNLAQCESGGNWHINTGNGFYGGLQFTLSTWHAYGGSGMPHHHSRASQIKVAERVQGSQGWGAWPACSANIGLR